MDKYKCISVYILPNDDVYKYTLLNKNTNEIVEYEKEELMYNIVEYGIEVDGLKLVPLQSDIDEEDFEWMSLEAEEMYGDRHSPESEFDMIDIDDSEMEAVYIPGMWDIQETDEINIITDEGYRRIVIDGKPIDVVHHLTIPVQLLYDEIDNVYFCGNTEEVAEKIKKYKLKCSLMGLREECEETESNATLYLLDKSLYIVSNQETFVVGLIIDLFDNMYLNKVEFKNVCTTELSWMCTLFTSCHINEVDMTGLNIHKSGNITNLFNACTIGNLKLDKITDESNMQMSIGRESRIDNIYINTIKLSKSALKKKYEAFKHLSIGKLNVGESDLDVSGYRRLFHHTYIKDSNDIKIKQAIFPISTYEPLYEHKSIEDILNKYIIRKKDGTVITARNRIRAYCGAMDGDNATELVLRGSDIINRTKLQMIVNARGFEKYAVAAFTFSVKTNTFKIYARNNQDEYIIMEGVLAGSSDELEGAMNKPETEQISKAYKEIPFIVDKIYKNVHNTTDNNQLILAMDNTLISIDKLYSRGASIYKRFTGVELGFID